MRVLAINPGSTSTKVALFDDETLVFSETLRHTAEELAPFPHVADQYEFRRDAVLSFLKERGIDLDTLDAVVGRGGLLRPIPSGTYRVNERMLADLRQPGEREHASNLGAMLAHEIAGQAEGSAFVVDPVCGDEGSAVQRGCIYNSSG